MIKVIIFDFFDVIRTDGFKRWLRHYGYEHTGDMLRATEMHDRGEHSDKEFFQNLANITNQTAEQVEQELEANNELNESLVDYIKRSERQIQNSPSLKFGFGLLAKRNRQVRLGKIL